MLGTVLAGTEVVAVERGVVTIRVLDDSPGHAAGVEHKREAIAKLVGEYVADAVQLHVLGAPPPVAGERPARLTAEAANAERLKRLRGKDQALGAAIDALDLELLE